MKNAFKLLAFFLLLIWSATAVRADWIDDFINQQIKQRKIPGLSVAVIKDGKVIKATGYGFANLELQVPATKETVYEIGSISKQFASDS
jgi:CubicO group peptidase (beta-lactamase class C family)